MPDYKELYLKLFRATETAISCLIEAQRECEELYINGAELKLSIFPFSEQEEENPSQDQPM